MTARFFIICFFIFSRLTAFSAPDANPFGNIGSPELSDQARVSVISCGPGNEIYSIFGHTALRIKDPESGLDRVYNYGTFQFDAPGFYLKFTGGKLAYFLSVSSFADFAASYIYENRALSEQVLFLSREERQQVFEKVEENLKPENRYYYYQFFSDNCTSRVYDLLQEVLGDRFKTDTSYIQEMKSYRELINPFLAEFPWVRVGMNMGLGMEADRKTHLKGRLFLPSEFEKALDHSLNQKVPLVVEEKVLFTPVEDPQKEAALFVDPFLFFSFLAILFLFVSYFEYRIGEHFFFPDALVFGLSGVIGVVLLLLWLFSAHTPTHQNLNLLWLNPLNLLMLVQWKRMKAVKQMYAKGSLLLLLSLLLLNLFVPLFIPEFYPIVIALLTRFSLSGIPRQKLSSSIDIFI